jgi:phosphatidylglycerophosphate synthase
MKIKILLLFFALLIAAPASYASFPVLRTVTTSNTVDGTQEEVSLMTPATATLKSDKFVTALLLFIFLWPFAAHRWYLGSPIGWNILFIVTLGGLGVWAIVDLIDIITEKYPGL